MQDTQSRIMPYNEHAPAGHPFITQNRELWSGAWAAQLGSNLVQSEIIVGIAGTSRFGDLGIHGLHFGPSAMILSSSLSRCW